MKSIKFLKKTLKGFVLFSVTVAGLSYGVPQLPFVKARIKSILTERLSTLTGQEVELGELSGFYPFSMTVSGFKIYDKDHDEKFALKVFNVRF